MPVLLKRVKTERPGGEPSIRTGWARRTFILPQVQYLIGNRGGLSRVLWFTLAGRFFSSPQSTTMLREIEIQGVNDAQGCSI